MKILIVEDEPVIARRLERMIRQILGEQLQDLHTCHTLTTGIQYVKQQEIDLLFLDLNLHGEDGFSILAELLARSFHTIVVSAYKEKALTAFEYGVLDFIAKPFSAQRIEQALERFIQSSAPIQQAARYVAIQKRNRHVLLEIQNISHIKGAGIYAEIYFLDGTTEVHSKNLDKLSQLLPAYFDRIHKSYIVNNTLIKELIVEPGGKYTLFLENDIQLPVSRTKYKELREKWAV